MRNHRVIFLHVLLSVAGLALCAPGLAAQATASQTDTDELSLAARRGDAAKVKALLDKGVDPNTKFRYDVTALFFACDRGHVDVVKVLLERGAEVNLNDKFYNSTPLNWAASPASIEEPTDAHVEIVKLLLAKGAQGGDQVLLSAARSGNLPMAQAVLELAKPNADTLTSALSTATTGKHDAVVEALRAAGAVPPFQVDAATLATYVGKYRADSGDLDILLNEGRLVASPGGQRIPLMATDKVSFKPEAFAGISVQFQLEGEKVVGLVLTQRGTPVNYKRVEEAKQP